MRAEGGLIPPAMGWCCFSVQFAQKVLKLESGKREKVTPVPYLGPTIGSLLTNHAQLALCVILDMSEAKFVNFSYKFQL